jgi:hypothetical protein
MLALTEVESFIRDEATHNRASLKDFCHHCSFTIDRPEISHLVTVVV